LRLWITRSEPGASRHAAALSEAGFPCLVHSVLAIEPLAAPAPKGTFQRLIFVSEHAVRCGLPRLRAAMPDLILPEPAYCLAIGPRTAAVLAAAGLNPAAREESASAGAARSDSEALLAHPLLAEVLGLRILLVAGEGGRSLIEDSLRARGAEVERFECYRRVPRLEPLPSGAAHRIEAIVVGSGEALPAIRNLWRQAGGADDVWLLVPSTRVAAQALAQGFVNVHDCGAAEVSAVLRALREVKHAGSE
jgi:uroporphyrinogen-III synthase